MLEAPLGLVDAITESSSFPTRRLIVEAGFKLEVANTALGLYS
jgi:hypothetical protein